MKKLQKFSSLKTVGTSIWPRNCYLLNVAVTIERQLHVSKVDKSKENGKDQASDTYQWLPCTWKWELSLADLSGAPKAPTIAQASAIEVSGFKPTLKVCEHNCVAHASMAPDKGHLEELGWITCIAWKKQQKEEKKRVEKDKAQHTTAKAQHSEAQSSMTHMSSHMAELVR